jgi:hypothetical protein
VIGCALAMRLVEYAEHAWTNRVPPAPPERAIATATSVQLPGDIVALLRRRHFRVTEGDDWIVVDRFPLAEAARCLAALGALTLLIGIALTSTWGWRSSDLSIGIGETVAVGHGTPYTLRMDSLQDDASGQAVLLKEIEPVASELIGPGRPMRAAGLSIHLQDTGPAVRANATLSTTGSQEQPLALQVSATTPPAGELLLRFTPDEPEQVFAAPDAGLLVRLSWSPSSSSSSSSQSFRVLVYRYRTRTAETVFEGDLPSLGGSRLQAGDATFELMPEKYARLTVTHDPGGWPTALGWLMGAVGLLGVLVWPVQWTWLRVGEDGLAEVVGDAL